MYEHTCHANGCKTGTAPSMLMCPKHWKMVPLKLRKEVWKYYQAGQEERKDPSKEWVLAAVAAIAAVYKKERKELQASKQTKLF